MGNDVISTRGKHSDFRGAVPEVVRQRTALAACGEAMDGRRVLKAGKRSD